MPVERLDDGLVHLVVGHLLGCGWILSERIEHDLFGLAQHFFGDARTIHFHYDCLSLDFLFT